MKNKNLFLAALFVLIFSRVGFSQNQPKAKQYNSLFFFYADNSADNRAIAMNTEVAATLENTIRAISQENNADNYFYFFASNGQKPKEYYNPAILIDKEALAGYLVKPSREADYFYEKQTIREAFTTYPVKIEHEVEINLFLSSYAIQKIVREPDAIPLPVTFPQEMIMYLNAKGAKVKINVYTNKEIADELGEATIKNLFLFGNSQLNLNNILYEFQFL